MKKNIKFLQLQERAKVIALDSRQLQTVKGGNNPPYPPSVANPTGELPSAILLDGGE